jgi:hypothetical protein
MAFPWTYPKPCNVRVSLERATFNAAVCLHTVVSRVETDQTGSREIDAIAAALILEFWLVTGTEECSQKFRYVWTNP